MPDFSIFRGLPVHFLSLANNHIRNVPERFLDGMIFSSAFGGQDPNIDLTMNPIGQNLPDEAFTGISAETLGLRLVNVSLTAMPKVALSKMENWTFLILGDNQIPSVGEGDFEPFTKVRNIDLSDNPITEIHDEAFRGVEESLKNLHLSDTRLADVPSAALKPLQALAVLSLDACRLHEIKDEAFGEFATEQQFTLKLQNNEIEEFSSTAFRGAKFQLRILHLQENSLSHLEFLYDYCAHVFSSSPTILLQGNPIDCTCDIFEAVESGRVVLEGTCGDGNSYASMDLREEFADVAAQDCGTSTIDTRCPKGDAVSLTYSWVLIIPSIWAMATTI